MKKRYSLSVLLVLLTALFLLSANYSRWERNIIYKGIDFKKVRFQTEKSDTLIIEGFLKGSSVINGIPCCDYILLKKDRRVQEVNLAEKFYMFDITFPKGSLLRFSKEGLLCDLATNTIVQGYLCSGNYIKKKNNELTTSFYENGELKRFYPPEDVTIDNIICKSGSQIYVELYVNGRLKQCTLAQQHSILDKTYEKDMLLFFDKNGNVIKTN